MAAVPKDMQVGIGKSIQERNARLQRNNPIFPAMNDEGWRLNVCKPIFITGQLIHTDGGFSL